MTKGSKYGKKVPGVSCQRAFNKLLAGFRESEPSAQRASGEGGEYDGKNQLLQELSDLQQAADEQQAEKSKEKQKKIDDAEQASEIRQDAMQTLSSKLSSETDSKYDKKQQKRKSNQLINLTKMESLESS
eukprot:NODE_42_length_34079_cov_0.552619.p20 type:complete len:130 gc:universal NODE_42_length_34079_cov_0.552619:19575-19186(-)